MGVTGPPDLDISSDGRNVVYVVGSALTELQMYMQTLGQLEPQSFPNIGSPIFPVFSPKGDRIAFLDFATRTLRVVLASGGSPFTITPVTGGIRGLSWEGDDTILFSDRRPA